MCWLLCSRILISLLCSRVSAGIVSSNEYLTIVTHNYPTGGEGPVSFSAALCQTDTNASTVQHGTVRGSLQYRDDGIAAYRPGTFVY